MRCVCQPMHLFYSFLEVMSSVLARLHLTSLRKDDIIRRKVIATTTPPISHLEKMAVQTHSKSKRRRKAFTDAEPEAVSSGVKHASSRMNVVGGGTSQRPPTDWLKHSCDRHDSSSSVNCPSSETFNLSGGHVLSVVSYVKLCGNSLSGVGVWLKRMGVCPRLRGVRAYAEQWLCSKWAWSCAKEVWSSLGDVWLHSSLDGSSWGVESVQPNTPPPSHD